MFYYISLFSFLILIFVNIFHFNSFDTEQREKDINAFQSVSNLSGVLQSVGFYEQRLSGFEDGRGIYYLSVPKINYLKLTYE